MNSKVQIWLLAILAGVSCCAGLNAQDNDTPAQEEKFEFDGCADLNSWMTDGDRKRDWSINDEQQLVCETPSYLYQRLEDLPEVCKIDIVISWNVKPNFHVGFGAPIASEQLDKNRLVRLENWEEAVVLSARDDFDVVQEDMGDDTKKLQFEIIYDERDGTIVVKDGGGKVLCNSSIGEDREGVAPGITIINRQRGDLVVERLKITEFDPMKKDK